MFFRSPGYAAAGDAEVVVNAPLTVAQADANTKAVSDRLLALEALTASGWVGLDPTTPFTLVGSSLYAKLSDGSTHGPYPIPQVSWNLTNPTSGAWLPNHQYYHFDAFNAGPALYLVLADHLSAATFDPNANDGMGQYYYGVVLDMPAVPPVGGATGQALTKHSGADYDTQWSTILPAGGTTGQSLVKVSGTDFNVGWGSPLPAGGSINQVLSKRSGADYDVQWVAPPTGITIGSTVIPGGGSTTALAGLTGFSLASGTIDIAGDTFLGRTGPAAWQLGQADSASPVPQTLEVQNAITGTIDGGGADFTINGSQGTGAANGGSIIFQVAPKGTSSGSGQNPLVEAGRIDAVTAAAIFPREPRISLTATQTLTSAGGVQYDNMGATAAVTLTLPSSAVGKILGFNAVVPSQVLAIQTPGGGGVITVGDLTITSLQAISGYLVLECVASLQWVVKSLSGNWSLT